MKQQNASKVIVKKIGLVYQIKIAPKKIGFNELAYTIDLIRKGEVTKGAYEGIRNAYIYAIFSFKVENFVKIAMGKMNPQIAFNPFIEGLSTWFQSISSNTSYFNLA
ncbi:putative SCP2 sterol-binding domain-containing protein [Rosa chinensis]|uniref:Putative SCP2 sterol-binding domain-containing protein n=1 Tax=Rosa chinensis TaxID=74649 RepID=A0A2P6QAH7_ROSCH|nr:putative SCP2 sterol-binding domain-containing protein [Rosa chinensis]